MIWLKRILADRPKEDCLLALRCPSHLAPGMTRTQFAEFTRSFVPTVAAIRCPAVSEPVPRRIWQCWWQGQDEVPPIIRACMKSVRNGLPDHEITIIDRDNYGKYVNIPATILSRFNSGKMPCANFTDYLRTVLLAKHGGLWIDASVLLTGTVPRETFESEFFMFSSSYWAERSDDPPSPDLLGALRFFASRPSLAMAASNWWIASAPGAAPVRTMQKLLDVYWERYDHPIDYMLYYDLLSLAFSVNDDCRRCWRKMAKLPSLSAQLLQELLPEPFDRKLWDAALRLSPVHKLTYKLPSELLPADSFYQHILATHET